MYSTGFGIPYDLVFKNLLQPIKWYFIFFLISGKNKQLFLQFRKKMAIYAYHSKSHGIKKYQL